MVKYSSADLLKDEMNWIGSQDFIGKMINRINKSATVLLTIQVPKNVFLRAAVLCDDIQELSELKFEQNDLINLLFNDFLLYAKKHPDEKPYFEGLSFTPLEFCPSKYSVGSAPSKGRKTTVNINFVSGKISVCDGKDEIKTVYRVALLKIGGKWLIDDVIYDNGETLTDAFNETKKIK